MEDQQYGTVSMILLFIGKKKKEAKTHTLVSSIPWAVLRTWTVFENFSLILVIYHSFRVGR